MGAADIVPGVSGGTIAFITNIYDELIESINSININSIKLLLKGNFKGFWTAVNGNFVLVLLLGIACSFLTLANVVHYLLNNHVELLWSFFFGLVLASIIYVGRKVEKWNGLKVIALLIGTGVAYYLTIQPPLGNSSESWYIFISGMIAICAMILPGISGSFILLILGSYITFITAIKDREIGTILVFGSGCIIGLLAFARVLKWMFNKYHDLTIAVLTGFLVGSLNKLWPWKENLQLLYTHSDGKKDYFQENVSPENFVGEPMILQCIITGLIGFGLIFGIEFIAKKLKVKS